MNKWLNEWIQRTDRNYQEVVNGNIEEELNIVTLKKLYFEDLDVWYNFPEVVNTDFLKYVLTRSFQ